MRDQTLNARWLEAFVRMNQQLVRRLDRLSPDGLRIVGAQDFREDLVPPYVFDGAVVLDVGGGKRPLISKEEKQRRQLKVTGLDLDENELRAAPSGSYDATIVADLTRYRGDGSADLVFCKSTLEHVHDAEAALRGIASLLKPGGRVLLFLPSRQALFAQLNRVLPEAVKRKLLFAVFPEKTHKAGFPAYYNRASLREYREMAARVGLLVEQERAYFTSSYFNFFAPLWIAWRIYVISMCTLRRNNFCEAFSMVLRKP